VCFKLSVSAAAAPLSFLPAAITTGPQSSECLQKSSSHVLSPLLHASAITCKFSLCPGLSFPVSFSKHILTVVGFHSWVLSFLSTIAFTLTGSGHFKSQSGSALATH